MSAGYRDRRHAGDVLAAALVPAVADVAPGELVVLGLPRGGVPVAAVVAEALDAPLDVVVVRKLGLPGQPELAMGALGEGGVRVLNDDVLAGAHVDAGALAAVEAAEQVELARRVRRYRGDRPPHPVAGRTVVVVDDGIATGATAAAACRVVRAQGAARVVLAAPVAPPGAAADLVPPADEVVCPLTPASFRGVGQWYAAFAATPDAEVVALLRAAADRHPG